MELEGSSDARLITRALSEDWPVTSEMRFQALEFAARLISSGDPKLGKFGAEILLKADALNVKKRIEEQKIANQEQERKRQLIEYAVKLGIVKPVDNRLGVIDSESSES